MRDVFRAFLQPKFECGCCEVLASSFCGARQTYYVFRLYSNPNLDNRINDCSLTLLASMQAEDVHALSFFLGDFNGHHQELLGFMIINRHELAAIDFATVSGCDQQDVGPTHSRGGTLDILTTDVSDQIRVAVVAPLGYSDQSSLSAVISMTKAVSNLCVSRKVFLNHRANWDPVCIAVRDLTWRNLWFTDNPFTDSLYVQLFLIVGRFVPPKVFVCVTRISLGLTMTVLIRTTSSWRIIFVGLVIALVCQLG